MKYDIILDRTDLHSPSVMCRADNMKDAKQLVSFHRAAVVDQDRYGQIVDFKGKTGFMFVNAGGEYYGNIRIEHAGIIK